MQLFDIFRPKGINQIKFTDSPTHIRFKWNSQLACLYLNKNEFVKLTPQLRYFVIMHEIGHLMTMKVFNQTLTQQDEDNADNYALEACRKVGIHFNSVQEARQMYHNALK
jgi:Zn-dependent peptidase ImmA (M78 family)